jgi:uncharacterized protein (DUF2141 family)
MNISQVCSATVVCVLLLGSGAPLAAGELEVVIKGFESTEGMAKIALWDNEEDFLETYLDGRTLPIEGDAVRTVYKDLPPGTYAVSVYHDENGNDILDRKSMGIPKEPTGFSNKHVPRFGPPRWKKAAFEVGEEPVVVTIKLR